MVRPKPCRVFCAVIISVSFTATIIAQNHGSSEKKQYLCTAIDEYNAQFYPCLADLPFLTVAPKSLRVYSPEGGELKVTVTSNRKWMLYCYENWISAFPQSGGGFNELIFKVMENPEAFERTAVIKIKAGGLPEKIIVLSQKARHDE